MADTSHKAPRTLKLIQDVNVALRRHGMTREDFIAELNEYLCAKRKIPNTHSGLVQISRWLDPTGNHWSEPKSEISLAFAAWLEGK